jgi:single-strand DNA-binding protein
MWNARSGGEESAGPGVILEEDEANGGMADSLNTWSVIGVLSEDPKYVAEGTPRANFTLLVKHGWKTPDGEHKEITEYVNVVAWRKLAETIGSYVTKGQKVFVEGRLQSRKYTDANGVEKRTTSLVANQVVFGGRPRTAGGIPGEDDQNAPPPEEGDDSGAADIPF